MKLVNRIAMTFSVLTVALGAAFVADNDAQAYSQVDARYPSRLGTAVYHTVTGTSNFYASTLTVPGPTVYRSRAYSGTQRIYVTRYILRTNPTNWGELYNTWTRAANPWTTSVLLPRGTKATFRSWNFAANPYSNYRVALRVSYYTSDGRFLSSIVTDYRHTGDYQCNSTNCSVVRGRDGRASMMLMY